MESLAEHYGFDLDKPFKKLSKKHRQIILHGSDGETVQFKHKTAKGRTRNRKHAFEGVLNTLQRRYKNTESTAVRNEIAKYLSTRPCESCHGSRLNKTARNVFVSDISIDHITAMSIALSLIHI